MQWEYKAIAIAFDGTTQLEAELSAMGKEKWELVHFGGEDEPEEDGLFYANCVFKRPVGGVRFVTVEGESGEIYHHRHADPTLTALDTLEQAIREQKRGAYRNKPGART